MADPFIGEIRMVGFNYAPRNWAMCNGAQLQIRQFTALFAVIGITFGGNGSTVFNVPNLQGGTPMGAGSGPNLTPRAPGQTGGATTVTLQQAQIPGHTHGMMCGSGPFTATLNSPANNVMLKATGNAYAPPGNQTPMAGGALQSVGSGTAHNNMMPYLAANFIIALQGVFPQRP